jgi:hypothetical protein
MPASHPNRTFARWFAAGVVLLAAGALQGKYDALASHPMNWGGRASGEFRFFNWGFASAIGLVLMVLDAVLREDETEGWDWLFPLKGRYARRLLINLATLLKITFALLVIHPFTVVF